MVRWCCLVLIASLVFAQSVDSGLPDNGNSVRFAVIGDSGTGEREQFEIGEQMERYRQTFPFDFVLMLGDNIYGSDEPGDMVKKFELPYKPLLDAGVKFYASLGNHDNANQRFYKPFNMGGKKYYSFKRGKAEFFALDSNYMDREQLNWLDKQLQQSNSRWKICFFHHPLYSDGKFHGPNKDLRAILEPLFGKAGVNVVLSGHEHVYERLVPQNGIQYFVLGNSGQLRFRNLRASPNMARGFDTDQSFMLVEIEGDRFHYRTISRTGSVVDSGNIELQKKPTSNTSAASDLHEESSPPVLHWR